MTSGIGLLLKSQSRLALRPSDLQYKAVLSSALLPWDTGLSFQRKQPKHFRKIGKLAVEQKIQKTEILLGLVWLTENILYQSILQ